MSQRPEDYRAVPTGGVSVVQANMGSTDRIRWGPIWAGIFAAISTMVLLGLLGVAIGLSALDAAETTRGFGIGAGIWQIITVVVAFFVGGWVAGRSSGFPGRNTGWLNGALVWAVSIPLALLLLSSGAGAAMGGLASFAAQSQQPRMSYRDAQPAGAQMGQDIQDLARQSQPEDESAINRAQGVAWWTFASFALGLAAAAGGGAAGIRSRDDLMRDDVSNRPERPTI